MILNKIENINLEGTKYIISINYESEDGIKYFEKIEDLKEYLNNNDFYKLYIFNENGMYSYINSDGDIIEEVVKIEDIKEIQHRDKYYVDETVNNLANGYKKIEVTYYLDEDNNKKFYYSGMVR